MMDTKIKTDINKEKLYLIRQILVDADKNGLALPDDVISLLQQESKLLLEKIVGWENINKQEILDFVFHTKRVSEDKEIILEELEKYTDSDFFSDYLEMFIAFSTLEPTREELEKMISNTKISFSKSISDFILKAKEKFSNSDILKILDPLLKNKEWNLCNITTMSNHFSDFYEYHKERIIPKEDLLIYLSWGVEEMEIINLLLSNHFASLLIESYFTQDEVKQIMIWIKETKKISHSIAKLFANANFRSLIVTESLSVNKVISFIEDKLKEKDFNSIIILSDVLENILKQVLDNYETEIVDHFALTARISTIYQKADNNSLLPPRKLYSYLNYDGDIYGFLSLISLFSKLEQEEQINIIYLLEQLSARQNISAIYLLILQLMQLDQNMQYIFYDLLGKNCTLGQKVNSDKDYYSVVSYLFSQLSIPSTQEDKEKLQTVKEILTRDPKLTTAETWESIFENKKSICQIIDWVFLTTEPYQRENMLKLTRERFETCEDYLRMLHHVATSVKEEENQEIYLRYKDKIEKVDQLLGEEKRKIKEIDTVNK